MVDAFTDKPFTGNPAAVCLLGGEHLRYMNEATMQAIAAEMNLSETAFVSPEEGTTFKSGTRFNLRWFTPTCEVPLCGHATLATAAVLFFGKGNSNQRLEFKTLSGVLAASRNVDLIVLDFPLSHCTPEDPSLHLQKLIHLAVGDLPLQDIQYSTSTKKLLLRLADVVRRKSLEQLKPDTVAMLEAHSGWRVKGVIVTMKGEEGYDFFSRYFAPWVGIPEDPVTGAAHTVLADYWSRQLGKESMVARQCSSRGGEIHVTVEEAGRVSLAGKACIVMQGRLRISLPEMKTRTAVQ